MNTGQIIKSRTTERFTVIPNNISQSDILTMEEKGLLSYLLSLPADWVLYKLTLYEKLPDSRGTIDRVFKMLQDKGYIVSVKVIDNLGHFSGWNHVVYDVPAKDLPTSGNADIGESRHRDLPISDITELGQSAPIQKTNILTNTNKKQSKRDMHVFIPPSVSDVIEYFKENDYSETVARKAFSYYNESAWKDSKGNPVKNWKQKMIAVWFKEENRNHKNDYVSKYGHDATNAKTFVSVADQINNGQ